MATKKDNRLTDIFDDFDPLASALGGSNKNDKKKAGFYLSTMLINRFDKVFYNLKAQGESIENKSALVEKMLTHALNELEKKGLQALK